MPNKVEMAYNSLTINNAGFLFVKYNAFICEIARFLYYTRNLFSKDFL